MKKGSVRMTKMQKKKVYLAGSIAGGREFSDNIKNISSVIESLGLRVVTKATTVNTSKKYTSSFTLAGRRRIVKRDKRWLSGSDFVVVEVSQYSHGVGYEHYHAENNNKPILLLRHDSLKDQRYSAFIDGTGYKKLMFTFYNETTIKDILIKFFKKYN